MVRFKNALTGYFIGDISTVMPGTTPDYAALATLELAHYISSVTDDSEETVEEQGFYDGDGTPESNVTTVKKVFTFEGFFDQADAAMAFVETLEQKTGEGRKVAFKQVRTDGTVYSGRATVTDIKVTGGDATEFAVFNCTINADMALTVTPAVPPEGP